MKFLHKQKQGTQISNGVFHKNTKPNILVLTWVFVDIAETCSSPFHTPSCHKLDVSEECIPTLENSKDGHCVFAFEVGNGSNPSCKDLELEGTVAGISTCAVDEVLWGTSKVAHPSFLGTDKSSAFSFEFTVEGSSERLAKKSTDASWDAWVSWFSLKNGTADEKDDWNRSTVGAWDAVADSSGALERSMLTDLVGPGGRGMPNALFWSGSEGWTGSEKKSTKLPEL